MCETIHSQPAGTGPETAGGSDPFDAPDDAPVALLIFLLVPEAATQRHLEILSEIAEMLSDRELRERLMSEPDAAGVHKLISDWEPLKSVA